MNIISFNRTITRNVTTIDITVLPTEDKQSVYSFALPSIAAGDKLIINGGGYIQVDNSVDIITQCNSMIQITGSAVYDPDEVGIITVVPQNGKGISKLVHYSTQQDSITWEAPSAYTGKYLHFVWWFTSPDAVSNDVDVVDFGFLTALQLR